jgi:hypothetical protein
MENNDFIGYVGEADLHDACISSMCYTGEQADVILRAHNGRQVKVTFTGVNRVVSTQPLGMMIYALNEMRADPPYRRFVFTNWDEEETATLEIEARDFKIEDMSDAQISGTAIRRNDSV